MASEGRACRIPLGLLLQLPCVYSFPMKTRYRRPYAINFKTNFPIVSIAIDTIDMWDSIRESMSPVLIYTTTLLPINGETTTLKSIGKSLYPL